MLNVFMQKSIQGAVVFILFIIALLVNRLKESIKVWIIVRFIVDRLVMREGNMFVLCVLSGVYFVTVEAVRVELLNRSVMLCQLMFMSVVWLTMRIRVAYFSVTNVLLDLLEVKHFNHFVV